MMGSFLRDLIIFSIVSGIVFGVLLVSVTNWVLS